MPIGMAQHNWKWFQDDAAEPVTQLAAENTAPALLNSNIIRLRVQFQHSLSDWGPSAFYLEYSTDNVNYYSLGAAAAWDYANGKAAVGDAVTSFLLTGSDTYKHYHENATGDETFSGTVTIGEVDIAIQPTSSVAASTLYYFRAIGLAPSTPYTNPQVTTWSGEADVTVNAGLQSGAKTLFSVSENTDQSIGQALVSGAGSLSSPSFVLDHILSQGLQVGSKEIFSVSEFTDQTISQGLLSSISSVLSAEEFADQVLFVGSVGGLGNIYDVTIEFIDALIYLGIPVATHYVFPASTQSDHTLGQGIIPGVGQIFGASAHSDQVLFQDIISALASIYEVSVSFSPEAGLSFVFVHKKRTEQIGEQGVDFNFEHKKRLNTLVQNIYPYLQGAFADSFDPDSFFVIDQPASGITPIKNFLFKHIG